MAKSLVEKFEQILSADPKSMVFVELAKSLIEQGEIAKAARVCRDGVTHHPDSILGRVLLGRALLLGKQADDASIEFDRALAIDPANPYGYNLVAEALLKHQLYGQAVPVLERAIALQPSDPRLRDWMAQAQSGGSAPLMPRTSTIGPLDRRLIPAAGARAAAATAAPAALPAPPPIPGRSSGSRPPRVSDMLLADLPENVPSRVPIALPKVTESEVQRIAQSYESDLRAEFEETKAVPLGFARRHWLVLTLGATAVVGTLAALGVRQVVRRHLGEKNAADFISRARQGLLQDTYASLSGAIHQMDELLEVQPHRGDALALAAQAQAMLCHDFGCPDAQKSQAQDWLEQAGPTGDPEAQLTARVYLAANPANLADEVLKKDPQTAGPWTHFLAGNALLARHAPDEALKRFDQALKLQPAHVPTLVTVAETDLQRGEPWRAEDLLLLAHTDSPLNVAAAVGLAEVHLATREPTDEDEKNLAQVAAAGPNSVPEPWRQRLDFARAKVLASNGKLDKAIALLQDGASQHGDEILAYKGALADCYIADGQYDRAESEAWGPASKASKDPEALARYGEILLARGRNRELLQRVSAIAGSRGLHVLRAQAALAAGNLALTRTEVEGTRKDNKVPATAGALLAEAEARGGHPAEAKATLRQIATLPHPPAEAFLGLAAIEQGAGDFDAAIADARRAVGADGRSYEAHCLLGRLLVKTGKIDEADTELRRAVRLNGQHVEARVALGMLQLEHGDARGAQSTFEAAVRETPTDVPANLGLARALMAQQKPTEAMRVAAQAVHAAPQDASAHHWLGKTALAAGDHKLALKELKIAKKLNKKDSGISEDLAQAERRR